MGNKGEKTKEIIRQEAYRLFAEKGFQRVTMTDICEKTGLSRGGVYRYYSSTGDIFSQILSEKTAARQMEQGKSPAVILEELLEEMKHEILDRESSLSLATYEYANLGNQDFFIELNHKAQEKWQQFISHGIETGEFADVDPRQMAELILYYYQGLRMWSRVIPFGEQEGDNFAETIRRMLLRNDAP
ncbi:MAG: TetR/AcrR family transcriptional regulator [Lachnospiraceae bacterium]|nr:TetR/AcrR family transcriptional regulator [Lachnospiraceae bacterium]